MSDLKDQFERDGFLVIRNFYSPEECDVLINKANHLAREFDFNGSASVFQTTDQSNTTDEYFLKSGNSISFFFEKDAFDHENKLKQSVESSFNKIGHALHDLDDSFNEFSRSKRLRELAMQIGAGGHHIIQSMFIFKHARIGGEVDIHQDSTFLYTQPDSCIGFWFALEDATIDNGCLWAKQGGHKTPLRKRFKRTSNGGTEMEVLNDLPLSMEGMKPLEVAKGSCIVLHGLLPHYSLPNTSGKSRPAYSIHTVDPGAVYPGDNWLQREISFELKGF